MIMLVVYASIFRGTSASERACFHLEKICVVDDPSPEPDLMLEHALWLSFRCLFALMDARFLTVQIH